MNLDLVVKIKFGSHLYGTNTPASDTDYKSVYIPEARDIILQRVKSSIQIGKKSKSDGEKNLSSDVDNEVYSLQRYLELVAEGQTVALDMLFAPENSTEVATGLWRYIQFHSKWLLTKKSAAFVGYCRTQANKYGIKGSRVAAAASALERFTYYESVYGTAAKVGTFFPEEEDRVIDEHTRLIRKDTPQGKAERYFECCNRLVSFRSTVKEAAAIFRKVHESYGDRARLAQNNQGIDWKALSHAVRVANEALELLRTHHITFPLPNAAHVLEIKQGKIPYNRVAEEIESLLSEVEQAAASSTLPDAPDYAFIDEIVLESYNSKIKES